MEWSGSWEWDCLVLINYNADCIDLTQNNQIKPLQILHAVAIVSLCTSVHNNDWFLCSVMTNFLRRVVTSEVLKFVIHTISKRQCFEAEAGLVVDCGNQKIHIPWSIWSEYALLMKFRQLIWRVIQCIWYEIENTFYRYLYNVLSKNQIVSENNRGLLVETLRSIAEILIWGDQNDSSVFE